MKTSSFFIAPMLFNGSGAIRDDDGQRQVPNNHHLKELPEKERGEPRPTTNNMEESRANTNKDHLDAMLLLLLEDTVPTLGQCNFHQDT